MSHWQNTGRQIDDADRDRGDTGDCSGQNEGYKGMRQRCLPEDEVIFSTHNASAALEHHGKALTG